jgi:hypothetical protein
MGLARTIMGWGGWGAAPKQLCLSLYRRESGMTCVYDASSGRKTVFADWQPANQEEHRVDSQRTTAVAPLVSTTMYGASESTIVATRYLDR